jgi:prophage antirepressor-like protein
MADIMDSTISAPGAPVLFDFNGMRVRVVERAGEPWFVLVDVCAVLEIANPRDAASRLDEDERDAVGSTDGISSGPGNPNLTVVNESGLWSLVLTSRKPQAKAFKKWITSEVIPSIRKTGGYGAPRAAIDLDDLPSLRALALQLITKAQENHHTIEAQREEIAELAPQAKAWAHIAELDGAMTLRQAAKVLQVPERRFISWLKEHGWVFRSPSPSSSGRLLGYSVREKAGHLTHRHHSYLNSAGEEAIAAQVLITPKGMQLLARYFGEGAAVPLLV